MFALLRQSRLLISVLLLSSIPLYGLFFGDRSLIEFYKKQNQLEQLKKNYQSQEQKNAELTKKIQALNSQNPDKDLLEELAKKKLGFSYEEERQTNLQ